MTNNNIKSIKYSSKDELFSATAELCEEQLKKAIKNNNAASFIIPGGTTPGPVFSQLSNAELDWRKVSIAQSDERWVEASHPQSNQRLTEKTLLINKAANAQYVPMKNIARSALEGEAICNEKYQSMASPFSLTMLGMGLDGHIASLFPNASIIQQALEEGKDKKCIAIDATGCEVAADYPEGMSLTFDAILQSELVIILMIGQPKFDVLTNATDNQDPVKYPISRLLNQQKTPIEIHWCE